MKLTQKTFISKWLLKISIIRFIEFYGWFVFYETHFKSFLIAFFTSFKSSVGLKKFVTSPFELTMNLEKFQGITSIYIFYLLPKALWNLK